MSRLFPDERKRIRRFTILIILIILVVMVLVVPGGIDAIANLIP